LDVKINVNVVRSKKSLFQQTFLKKLDDFKRNSQFSSVM